MSRFRRIVLTAFGPLVAIGAVLLSVGFVLVSTRHVDADCIWRAEGKAFIDANSNGLFDSDELPLEGVVFHVDDTLNGYIDVGGKPKTDTQGQAGLSVWLPGSPSALFQVYTDVPPNYQLTTQARVDSHKGYGETFVFGYAPAK